MRAVLAAGLLAPAAAPVPPVIRLDGTPVQGSLVRDLAPVGTASLTLDGRQIPLAADGRFIRGFDRAAGPNARLVAPKRRWRRGRSADPDLHRVSGR